MTGKPPRSLGDFDYFDEKAQPAASDDVLRSHHDEELDAYLAARRGQIQRGWFTLLASSAFLVVGTWFMAGYVDAARYAFSSASDPLELGDAADFTPSEVPHNAYVRVHGITEHRGLKQELVRGLGLSKTDYWYFRLLGSRGTFIEVEPDAKRYGTTTEVTVTGRAVDPAREPLYGGLLKGYSDIFGTETRAETRIIQVGLEPGTHRLPYGVAALVLGALGIANVVAVIRVILTLVRRA